MNGKVQTAIILVLLCLTGTGNWLGCRKQKSGRDLDILLQQGRYDDVIKKGTAALKEHPDDYGLLIVVGDAYFLKAKKFNRDAGKFYTPEGAALAQKAIEYYKKSKELHPSMRVDQKIGMAGALMSP